MKQKLISGLIVPLLTPMNEDLSIDRIALKTLTARLMNKGVKNFFVLGPLGEQNFLSVEKEREVIGVVANTLAKKGNLLIGCFANSAEEIIEKVRFAERFTDYCVINVPFSGLTNEISFIDFFDKLFTRTKANVFVCNDPSDFKRNVPIVGLDRIANWERLIGVIDYSNNMSYFKALSDYYQSLKIFQGNEESSLDSIDYHCSGLAVGLANIFPNYFLDFFKEKDDFAFNELLRRQTKINSLLKEFFPKGKRIQALKLLLATEGVMQTFFSKEIDDLDEVEIKQLEDFFEKSTA